MKLLAGSPALDIRTVGCTGVDQRGVARPQGAGCDAGAFESALAPSVPPTITTPAPDTYTSASELQFTGTATPDASVRSTSGRRGRRGDRGERPGRVVGHRRRSRPPTASTRTASRADGSTRPTVQVNVDRTRPDDHDRLAARRRSPTATTSTFTYSSNEPGTFACRLVGPGTRRHVRRRAPRPGRATPGLANGEYEFRVRAIDRAGNTDESAEVYSVHRRPGADRRARRVRGRDRADRGDVDVRHRAGRPHVHVPTGRTGARRDVRRLRLARSATTGSRPAPTGSRCAPPTRPATSRTPRAGVHDRRRAARRRAADSRRRPRLPRPARRRRRRRSRMSASPS